MNRVLSGINSAFQHPLISEFISRQCFFTVLILGYAWGSQSHSGFFLCFGNLLQKIIKNKILSGGVTKQQEAIESIKNHQKTLGGVRKLQETS